MSITLHRIPSVLAVILLALVGCGDATYVSLETQPVLVTPSSSLPKNLVSRAELVVATPDGGLTVVVEGVTVTVRQDANGQEVATVSAFGVLRASVPADILLFELVLEPSDPSASWVEHVDAGARYAVYPTQLAASEGGRWHWQTRATTDARIASGLVVRVRLTYEALL